jgi:hypothetical protein
MAISDIPNTFIVTYEDNMRLALGQQQSILWDLLPETAGTGEKKKLDDIVGNVKGQKRTTRNADTNITDGTHSRVWVVAPDPVDNGFLVDTMDQLESGIMLQSGYVMANAGMIARAKNDAFIGGFFGSMITGKSGTVSTAFSGSMVVPVATGASAPARMNVEKLRYARKLLAKGFVDKSEPWYVGLTAEQIDDLTGQVPVTNADFTASYKPRWSADGRQLLGLCGFEFVEDELSNSMYDNAPLTLDVSSYRKNPFWARSGMRRVPWEDMYTSLSIRHDKGDAAQIYARTAVAATRTDNAKCGYILNSEA